MFLEIGKWADVPPASLSAVGGPATPLKVTDQCSSQVLLVDTGAEVSVIPTLTSMQASLLTSDHTSTLHVAIGTKINTYGHCTVWPLPLNCLSLHRRCSASTGADSLCKYQLLVDLSGDQLLLPELLTFPCPDSIYDLQ